MMSSTYTITVDLERCEVVLGAGSVPLEPSEQPNTFRLPDGTIIRAITFAERSGAVRSALASDSPVEMLIGGLRAMALQGAASSLADAVMLALAGGAEEAPAFAVCAIQTARSCGWDWRSVNDALAIQVDRAAARASAQVESTWTRFVFASHDSTELEEACLDMAERLLARATEETLAEESASPHTSVQHAPSQGRLSVAPPRAFTQPSPTVTPGNSEPQASATREIQAEASAILSPSAPAGAFVISNRRLREQWPEAATPANIEAVKKPEPSPTASARAARANGKTVARAVSSEWPPAQPQSRAVSARPATALDQHQPSVWAPVHFESPTFTGFTSDLQPQSEATPVRYAPHRPEQSEAKSLPHARQSPETDWLDEIAHALEAECDLRGIDA